MRKERIVIKGFSGALLAAATMATGPAGADLIDRSGGLIYDDVLDITWLQDANYAQTSGYDADGAMIWDEAVAWADQLVYGGYDDWRLPTIVDTGPAGCDFANSGTDCGYNVQTTDGSTVYSEMASLFYDTLGNVGGLDASGALTGCGIGGGSCLSNTGPFGNVVHSAYWSGTEYAPSTDQAWDFNFGGGFQEGPIIKNFPLFAWAVRPGDVVTTVPEPGTLGLLGAGLGLLGIMGRRKRRRRLALQ